MKTILLIDDDQQIRNSFGMVLRRNSYNVLEAESGSDGLKMAQQHLPDLILSDIHMPGGSGSTLLSDIRNNSELRTKQVVLMTGRPDLVSPRKGMDDGADDFLVKPVSMEALLKCMEARFNRSSISWRVEDQMLDRLRSSVPANLPHEFFTPMAGIIGLMEIVRLDGRSMTCEELDEIYTDIYQSALRLNRTLRNYLLILDLKSAPLDLLLFPLTPDQVAVSVQMGVEEALRLNKRQDDVAIKLGVCAVSILSADLSRLVEELVDNACKFSRQGTPVKVELTDHGRLVVTDQGRGMTSEQIKHIGIFKQFDRKKNEQQGLGLGLVLVQKLTEQYQSKFSIDSQPGAGSQVQIAFPLANPA